MCEHVSIVEIKIVFSYCTILEINSIQIKGSKESVNEIGRN